MIPELLKNRSGKTTIHKSTQWVWFSPVTFSRYLKFLEYVGVFGFHKRVGVPFISTRLYMEI